MNRGDVPLIDRSSCNAPLGQRPNQLRHQSIKTLVKTQLASLLREQLRVSEPAHRFNSGDTEELVERGADDDVRLPEKMPVRVAVRPAEVHDAIAQPHPRGLELLRLLAHVRPRQRDAEWEAARCKLIQCPEEGSRILVILPALIPKDQRRRVTVT